jgi:hypothetical protein
VGRDARERRRGRARDVPRRAFERLDLRRERRRVALRQRAGLVGGDDVGARELLEAV